MQNHVNLAVADFAAGSFGKFRPAFQKIFALALGLETPGGKARHHFGDDGGYGFIPDQNPALHFRFAVFKTNRRDEGVIARLQPRFGFLPRLPPDLLALKLSLRGEKCFDKFALRRVIEFIVQAFQTRAEIPHRMAQLPVEHGVAGKAFEVIEYHHEIVFAVFLKIIEQRDHARTFCEITTARHVIMKHLVHDIAFFRRILAAAKFLALQS